MASRLITMTDAKAVTFAVTATRPTSDSDGVDITGWRLTAGYVYCPGVAVLRLQGSAALTLASPTDGLDGPELWGYRDAAWWRLGYLNNGLDILIVGADQGFAAEVDFVGVFDRIAVAGTPSAGSVTAILTPLQEWQIP